MEKQLFASFCEFVKFRLALLELMQLQCFQVFYCLFVSGRKNQKYCVYVCGSKCKSALYELVPAWHRFVFNRCVCSLRVVACPQRIVYTQSAEFFSCLFMTNEKSTNPLYFFSLFLLGLSMIV